MEIRTGSLDFSQPLSGAGPRQASTTLVFPLAVTAATAGLTGYLAEYSGGNDHHVGRIEITLDAAIAQNTVTVDGTFGLRDWSGNWDDAYDGNIDFVVVAELESATAPPPRADLTITGMETVQAAQFFRSSSFLTRLTSALIIRSSLSPVRTPVSACIPTGILTWACRPSSS